MSGIPKLEPLSHFIGQLDLSEYGTKAEVNKAARELRAVRKRHLDGLRADERDFARRQLTMAEKRGKVRAGTHRWCRKCRGRGFLRGKDGVVLPHGECRGDGLIRAGAGSGRRRGRGGRVRGRGRGRVRSSSPRRRASPLVRSARYAAGCSFLVGVAGESFGTVGQVVAIVVVVVVTLVRVLAMLLRGVAAVAR